MALTGYIVVRAKHFHKHFVLPVNWIYELNLEKTLYFGLNPNQEHLCYYSSKPDNCDFFAVDEEGNAKSKPKGNPKFDICFVQIISTPNFDFDQAWESTFKGYLLRYFGKLKWFFGIRKSVVQIKCVACKRFVVYVISEDYDRAEKYCQTRRDTVRPAVYNRNRLRELPIPVAEFPGPGGVSNGQAEDDESSMDSMDYSVCTIGSDSESMGAADDNVDNNDIVGAQIPFDEDDEVEVKYNQLVKYVLWCSI